MDQEQREMMKSLIRWTVRLEVPTVVAVEVIRSHMSNEKKKSTWTPLSTITSKSNLARYRK